MKLPRYAEYRVGYAWLVDPVSRTLEVSRLVDRRWTMVGAHGADEQVRAKPFDAIELDLKLLWPVEE